MKSYERRDSTDRFNRSYKYVFGIISLCTVVFVLYFSYFSFTNDDISSTTYMQSDQFTYTTTVVHKDSATSELFARDTLRRSIKRNEFEQKHSKCHIPNLVPFDESILPYWENSEQINCTEEFPLLFAKDFDSNLLFKDHPDKYGYLHCSYKYLIRKNDSDNSVIYSEETFLINETSTKIPKHHEFISVSCSTINTSKIVDMFPFVPLRNNTAKSNLDKFKYSINKEKQFYTEENRYNYVILGMDAVSHMNFIRSVPKSYNFLVRKLNSFAMNGYTKIGGNTYPNLVGVLMGKNVTEIQDSCLSSEIGQGFYDDCPFIWKNFSQQGYITSYYEDSPWMGIFNYVKKGFKNPPTDYYGRPFTYMADNTIGSKKLSNSYICSGPRLAFNVLLEYVQQMAVTMQRNVQNYFQFVWSTSLTHDYLNKGMLGDEMLLNTLKMFSDRKYLDNTVLILTSDHGALWGDIRNTQQGRIEERMPLLYFVIPKNMSQNPLYKWALNNLKVNRRRLTTPYDLHETLKDFLNMSSLENYSIKQRTLQLLRTHKVPRGISLFLPIPLSRGCKQAGIGEHFCVCNSVENVPVENNTNVFEAAEKVVKTINDILKTGGENASNCANLTLKSVLTAQKMELNDSTSQSESYEDSNDVDDMILTVNLITTPANASFEATVKRYRRKDFRWEVLGEISRTNLYGNQSYCVHNYELKKYCYCLQ